MIKLSKWDGKSFTLNPDLIVSVESAPDTVITLTTGGKLWVRESEAEVTRRVLEFRQRLLQKGHDWT